MQPKFSSDYLKKVAKRWLRAFGVNILKPETASDLRFSVPPVGLEPTLER